MVKFLTLLKLLIIVDTFSVSTFAVKSSLFEDKERLYYGYLRSNLNTVGSSRLRQLQEGEEALVQANSPISRWKPCPKLCVSRKKLRNVKCEINQCEGCKTCICQNCALDLKLCETHVCADCSQCKFASSPAETNVKIIREMRVKNQIKKVKNQNQQQTKNKNKKRKPQMNREKNRKRKKKNAMRNKHTLDHTFRLEPTRPPSYSSSPTLPPSHSSSPTNFPSSPEATPSLLTSNSLPSSLSKSSSLSMSLPSPTPSKQIPQHSRLCRFTVRLELECPLNEAKVNQNSKIDEAKLIQDGENDLEDGMLDYLNTHAACTFDDDISFSYTSLMLMEPDTEGRNNGRKQSVSVNGSYRWPPRICLSCVFKSMSSNKTDAILPSETMTTRTDGSCRKLASNGNVLRSFTTGIFGDCKIVNTDITEEHFIDLIP